MQDTPHLYVSIVHHVLTDWSARRATVVHVTNSYHELRDN
jgi:hypothetical protein